MRKPKPTIPDHFKLRDSCSKLRGLSYLIELCGDHPAPPFDEGNAFYGVSLIMNDIHAEILDYARAVERWEIYREQRREAVNQNQKPVKLG